MVSQIASYLVGLRVLWPALADLDGGRARAAPRRSLAASGSGRSTPPGSVFGVGLIASATLTPSRAALLRGATGSGQCDFGSIALPSLSDLLTIGDPAFNVLLYLPLGLAVGLLPRSRLQIVGIAFAAALPFAIETVQLIALRLDRACQTDDVINNLVGLALGLVLGVAIGFIRDRLAAGPGSEEDVAG